MSRFWSLGRSTTSGAVTAAVAVEPTLEPVELYTSQAMILGLVTPHDERLSDILNREPALLVHQPQMTSYVDRSDERDLQVVSITSEEILIAMPPTHAPNPGRRIHRKRRRVVFKVGSFEVIGTAHMPPGTELDPYVLRSRVRFIAVTDALVRYDGDPVFARSAPVVLVNTSKLTRVDDLLQVD